MKKIFILLLTLIFILTTLSQATSDDIKIDPEPNIHIFPFEDTDNGNTSVDYIDDGLIKIISNRSTKIRFSVQTDLKNKDLNNGSLCVHENISNYTVYPLPTKDFINIEKATIKEGTNYILYTIDIDGESLKGRSYLFYIDVFLSGEKVSKIGTQEVYIVLEDYIGDYEECKTVIVETSGFGTFLVIIAIAGAALILILTVTRP